MLTFPNINITPATHTHTQSAAPGTRPEKTEAAPSGFVASVVMLERAEINLRLGCGGFLIVLSQRDVFKKKHVIISKYTFH